MRIEPDGKSFGKVFNRVRLCVPIGEVDDVIAALWMGLVRRGVRRLRIAKQGSIAFAAVQTVCIIDGVPRFMPKDPSAFRLASTFDLQHLAALEPHEARMCEIERNGEPKHTIRVEDFL